ncbi:MAG: sulfatase [Bryobacteraceae bacterium]
MLTRRAFLAAPAALAQPASRLNVLFLAVDDLTTRLGCYGAPVLSPNIDALAKTGVRFERAYCQYPLCNPSRSSLLTGRRPPSTGILENQTWFRKKMPDAITLPQFFKESGYVTAQTGKIFHGGLDDDRAWTIGGTPLVEARPRTPEEQAARQKTADRWVAVDGEGEGQLDFRTASRAVELLGELKAKPFFLAVGFAKPHVPFIAPKKYFELYDPDRMQLPGDFATMPASTDPSHRPNFDIFIRREAGEQQARQAIAAYYASISFMDAQVGRVLAALDQHGLRRKTAIVFFGDHGFHLGEKGMWSKMSLFEASTHVPLIVSSPGARGNGRTSPRTAELVDMYPTLAEVCGLRAPGGLDGESLGRLLDQPTSRWDNPAYTWVQRGSVLGATVRTERYRYTEWNGAQAELYDHSVDGDETRNLASDPKHKATTDSMQRLLRRQGNANQ